MCLSQRRPLDLIIQEPEPATRLWMSAYEELEDFYIRFPVHLLKFDDLEFPYQAEAMVWMHGMFMMLCEPRACFVVCHSDVANPPTPDTKCDLLNILLDPKLVCSRIFSHVLGHSLLLGEVGQ